MKLKVRQVLAIGLILFFQILGIQGIKAEIKLPAIVSSNMVLQRNTTVKIWGWADANEKISIEASWLKKSKNLRADANGDWSLEVETTNSKVPQTIQLKSKTSNIFLENILFGEVWLCSGQSNMFQPLKGYRGQPTFGAMNAIVNSYNPNLRLFTVGKIGAKAPQKQIEKYTSWQEASLQTVPGFSAVAYFFGQQLQQILDVPVGLIHTSWGGSSVQAWMSKESLSPYKKVDLENVDITKRPNQISTTLYNAMLHPLVQYKIKGALWYQGESNRGEPENYKKMFPAMVKDWRTRFNSGDFPFYYVQIAPYDYDISKPKEKRNNSAFIREVQLQCVDLIPNAGIAITMDIGNKTFIHPPKKKEVADRLLYNALYKTYGFKNVDYVSPRYDSFKIEKDIIKVKFKNVKLGLYAFDELQDFEIAGADKVFYPAEAEILNRNNIISVKSSKVLNPVAVRYAFKNYVEGTLYGANLLPVSSFRTDSWSDATQADE